MAYNGLGREEDPPFTIKTMVVKTLWPGATTTETINQITDRIEKKLEEVPHLDYVRSYTKPGKSVVFVNLKDSVRAAEVPDLWYQVRKKVGDIRQNLPSGIYGPYFNDEFGDTYSIIYALTADGFSQREVRDYAERVRTALLLVPDVAKVDLIGVQDEKIYLEFSTQQIAALGIDINALVQALQAQNAVAPSGTVEAGPERIAIRVSGGFTSEESLKAINFRVQRPLLPAERHRQGATRLRRSGAALVPLQRRACHRPRHRHGRRRRCAGARQEHPGTRRARDGRTAHRHRHASGRRSTARRERVGPRVRQDADGSRSPSCCW